MPGVTPTADNDISFGLGDSRFTQTYTSFSGCDIKAHFGDILLGNIQGISFSITREKAPIFVMGSTDPVSFSRGKRGIAGSLIFTIFDRAALSEVMSAAEYAAKTTDIRAGGRSKQVKDISNNFGLELRMPNYIDQIPPFQITLTGENEYGNMMRMQIFGVELLNEGSGISIDDITNEAQVTFVSRAIKPWTHVSSTQEIIDSPTGQTIAELSPAVDVETLVSQQLEATQ